MELIFDEPPARVPHGSGRPNEIDPWLLEVQKNPGVWVKYPKPVSASTIASVRKGRRKIPTLGLFEIETRPVEKSGPKTKTKYRTLYCKYIGPTEETSDEG
jgi:hypothetical protein